MARPSLVVVLAEDARHQRFVRHFLYNKGLSPHEIRMEPLPIGKGCGEQWVRERYAAAVEAYRMRSAKAKSALVVVIDADNRAVDIRQRQLREVLKQGSVTERSDAESIAHFIPKRSIETWVLCLDGRSVDEETDYSGHQDVDRLIKGAAREFFAASRLNAARMNNTIDSLSTGIPEARRLD